MSAGPPGRFEIDEQGGAFRIHWKWPRFVAVPLLLFSAAWDVALAFWYYQALGQDQPSLLALLFPIGHVAVGLVLPYMALAFWFNRHVIEIAGGELRVAHRPFPAPGQRRIQVIELRQLFSVARPRRRGGSAYAVMARLSSDREVTLISGLSTDREARFVEEQIEQRVGLANDPVTGELRTTPSR